MLYSVVQMVLEKNPLMFLSKSLAHFTWQVGDGWKQEKQYVFRKLNCCVMQYIKQTHARTSFT